MASACSGKSSRTLGKNTNTNTTWEEAAERRGASISGEIAMSGRSAWATHADGGPRLGRCAGGRRVGRRETATERQQPEGSAMQAGEAPASHGGAVRQQPVS